MLRWAHPYRVGLLRGSLIAQPSPVVPPGLSSYKVAANSVSLAQIAALFATLQCSKNPCISPNLQSPYNATTFARMGFFEYAIAIIGGLSAGIINTLAGNGSAITLTILTEVLGLPGNVANGTNRVGVLSSGIASSYGFYQGGRLDVRRNWQYIVPTVIGAMLGVWVAVNVSNEEFKAVFRWLMIIMLFVVLVKPKRWLRETDEHRQLPYWVVVPVFLGLGFYGGFIQMGMGIFFLAVTVLLARLSLTEANAVKVFVVAIYTVVVLAIFHSQGLVDWKIGGIVAIGQTIGGYFTARIAAQHPNANVWAHRMLVLVMIAVVLRLFGVF